MKYYLFLLSFFLCFASQEAPAKTMLLTGKVGNVSYTLHFKNENHKAEIQSLIPQLFMQIDSSLSSKSANSYVSNFNSKGRTFVDQAFYDLFYHSYQVFANTKGNYNPTDIAYENYWATHDYKLATKQDSFHIDTIYKYNVFSGFIEYDSVFNAAGDTGTILATEDFNFPIGFDELLAAYKLEMLIYQLKSYEDQSLLKADIVDDGLFLQNKLSIHYNPKDGGQYQLDINYNYGMDKHGYIFPIKAGSKAYKILCDSALEGACYLSALHKTGLNNNHAYWTALLKIQ